MARMRKKCISFMIIFSLVLGIVTVSGKAAEAAAPSGIAGNGTDGIYIDINAAPYTTYANIPTWGQYAYTTAGCAWFASARVNQLTGANCTIYSGKSWYNSAYASFGFSRGKALQAKALACYENHVSVIENVNGNSATVSEGGYTSVNASNGYCIIHSLSKAEIESARGGGFLGYVYLTGASQQPSAQGLSYSNLQTTSVDTWNAGLYGEISNPGRLTVSEVGVQIWDSAGTLVVNHKEGCGLNNSVVKQQLNIVGEALPSGLRSGETYTWKMFAVANGNTYNSETGQFTVVDDQKPVISDVKVTNVSSEGYTVSCTVTDNYRVEKVQFPTWTDANGQDDIQENWGNSSKAAGTKNGNTYTFRVNVSEHKNESGIYHTHIYAWDKAGNQTLVVAPDTKVPEKSTVPVATLTPTVKPTPAPATAVPAPVQSTAPSVQQPAITPEPYNVQSSNFTSSYINYLTDTAATLKATIPLQYMTEWGIYFGNSPSALKKYFGNTPNCNVRSMTYDYKNLSADTVYYYYFYYSTGTKTVASKLYSFATRRSNSNSTSSRYFESIKTTSLTDTTANFQVTIPSSSISGWGYYFGKDLNNLKQNVIEDNVKKNVSWMKFGQKNLIPNTLYYFCIYYVTEGRTVLSQLYYITTKSSPVIPPKQVTLYAPYSLKKKTLTIPWSADISANGYQIQYATDKNFRFGKNLYINSGNSNSTKITKLQSKKKYYVRIRAYKNSAGGTVYGSWSEVKSCKVK